VTDARSPRRPWSAGLFLAVAIGAYGGAISEAAICLVRQGPWNWAEMALRGLGPAIGWGLVFGLQNAGRFPTRKGRRRRAGSPDTAGAISTGILPPDADPDRWRPWLELERRELTQVRWLTLALWVPGGALVAAAATMTTDWAVWALAAGLVAFGLVGFRGLTARARSARRLLDALARPSGARDDR
jgi:hypothetical protein